MKKILIVISVLISIGWTQSNFTLHTLLGGPGTPHNPQYAMSCDLDQDGEMDVVAASESDTRIVWYEGQGNQIFLYHSLINTNDYVYFVDVADVDQDGDLDIVSAENTSVKLYVNKGNQTFTSSTITSDVQSGRCARFADINGDGALDIIIASYSNDRVAWYEQYKGSFIEHVVSTSEDGACRVFAADVDDDGYNDILVASEGNNTVSWYRQNKYGNFSREELGNISYACDVSAADMDNDGDIDVAATGRNGELKIFENQNNSSFSEYITAVRNFNSLYLRDIDNDNWVDIVACNSSSLYWYENQGGLSFTETKIDDQLNNSHSVFATDLNEDNLGDIVLTTLNSDQVIVYYNHPLKDFTVQQISDTVASAAMAVKIIDMDRDGDIDIIGASGNDNSIRWFENDGSENFVTHLVSDTSSSCDDVFAIDLDLDGDIDILPANLYDGRNIWYENNGQMVFSNRRVHDNYHNYASAVYAADIDHNGDIEIIKAHKYSEDRQYKYTNKQDGTYSEKGCGGMDEPEALFCADLTNNDTLETVTAYSKGIYVVELLASGQFSSYLIDTNEVNTKDVWVADIDNDGLNDIISCSSFKVIWYRNQGANYSFDKIIISEGDLSYIQAVCAVDLDGDGYMDIIAGDKQNGTMAFLNDGNENFTPQLLNDEIDDVRDIYPQDIDHDGDVDLALASAKNDCIAWLENAGPSFMAAHTDPIIQQFQLKQNFPNPFNPVTTISFVLPERCRVRLEVINTAGQVVKTLYEGALSAGEQRVQFKPQNLSSGVYFYRLRTSTGFEKVKKMIYLR